jgi:hypothetical protein
MRAAKSGWHAHDEGFKSLHRSHPMISPSTPAATAQRLPFARFFHEVFLPEHQHPVNRALHIGGTWAGLAYAAAVLALASPWWLLLFPLVHAGPGLIGHRLFERNAAVGDVRVLRQDYPGYWFMAANHWMTALWLVGRLPSAGAAR